LDPSNRRISLIVQYVVKDEDEDSVHPPNADPDGKTQPSPPDQPAHP
jgi:hypothetical protein